ncbi:MAG: pantoate--beta-alanine ligase [Granulosicoccus sp.]|jgi:pantoate--beta-alanine ligase
MQIFRHIQSLRESLDADRQAGKRIGFVPTMGNLHDGHLALVKTAKLQCDVVVASIFVNRLQFGLNEDWDQYPRTFSDDCQKLINTQCDYLFFPEEKEIYPNGMDGQTRVVVPSMTDMLCGSSRPGHFEGVTTVVSKLLNIIQPHAAVFGLKDYQQIAVIRRMVQDLCIPVEIVAGEIVREHDGLAMSSRNHFISSDERPQANQLQACLLWAKQQVIDGNREYLAIEAESHSRIIAAGFRVDYFQICSSDTLMPAALDDGDITILGAMYTQAARLIDNISLKI